MALDRSAHHAALGLELRDALGRHRALVPVAVRLERPGLGADHGPSLPRSASGIYAWLYQSLEAGSLDVRISDARRHYVPRRLRVAFPSLTAALQAPPRLRLRAVALFPGAAYPLAGATGLRGRVGQGDRPVRWPRVLASHVVGGMRRIVGCAHGDDRGEFVLVLRPEAYLAVVPADPSRLRLDVEVLAPTAPAASDADPLADLALENLGPAIDAPDAVELDAAASGERIPEGYARLVQRTVRFELGRVRTDEPAFLPDP